MRIVRDASRKLGVSHKDLFTMACAMRGEGDDPEDLWRYYQKSNSIPCWLVDWLIDTMNPKKGGQLDGSRNSGSNSPVPSVQHHHGRTDTAKKVA